MKKLIVVDNGNVLHKAIFAYIAQYKAELMKIVYSNISKDKYETLSEIEQEKLKENADKILQEKIINRQVFILNPVSTYLRMIIGYLKKIGVTLDDRVILAEDYGSWRKEIDSNYKVQRKEYRESKLEASKWSELYDKFNKFMLQLDDCLPWSRLKIYKMESDDIASCAVRYLDNYDEKILISSDEDWQMLCSIPNVKIFSPYSKKYKIVKNPEKILLKKIQGDVSDNLLEKPKTEAEWEQRKMIVDLLHLPQHIEDIIKQQLFNMPIRELRVNKVPFKSCQESIKQLYKIGV